ncbi:MAG: glutaredoxin family protein [Pseudomonadota bacterium]
MGHKLLRLVIYSTLMSLSAFTQAQSVFRWVDGAGKVHYTDRPPQETVKQIQEKKMTYSMIQTSGDNYALQVATRKFPATFFTSGDCIEICTKAKAFLDKRGIPYTEVDVNTQAEKLIRVTGNTKVPVLTLGPTTIIHGWEENRWANALEQAGYPRAISASATNAAKAAANPTPANKPDSYSQVDQ